MDKTYRPADVETRHYEAWEQSGAFGCMISANGAPNGSRPYAIVIPPPNVTGSLHMGHALNSTLQDALIRFARMRGRDALWQPGTDHAGIATQMVVERQLAEEGKTRHDLGRDAFIDRVWTWKAESGGTITGQLRRLGASCDWSRERFTMDDGLSAAVRRVFVTLHKQGLVYRDKRLVNWDSKLHTAISDLEVEQREVKGHLWYFKYPIEGEPDAFITVATTRPETMLGDTAVAVHPEDDRYRNLVGKNAVLPIVGRAIPIVADDYSDPEKGTGAVKITPAHDFNDFEVGRRHDLPLVNIFDENACLNDEVPARLRGLDRDAARKRVLAEMEALDLLVKTEDNPMTVPYGDRSGVVIEPRLTDQWFVDAATLAKPAIEAVERGSVEFVPAHWTNTYFDWMRNIQPWCVSRQIWWGHQIPAWYGPDGRIFVEETEDQASAAAAAHYGHAVELVRDPDVLDTWFSSALWPFSTLGWPEQSEALARYYPTDVLVTGFDIIFFWVARMIMMGMHFMREVPFRTVYIHALVRDEGGQKMSKSKGNVLDPLELIDQYGADALRFTLAALAAQGRDIKLSAGRVEGYRNFVTKIWNAARYMRINECRPERSFDANKCRLTVNRWIIHKIVELEKDVTAGLEAYKFNDAAGALYQFVWGTFCDWYLEFTKPILTGNDGEKIAETRGTIAWAVDQILLFLHPFMPFVTEELWAQMADHPRPALITSSWPAYRLIRPKPSAAKEMDWIVRLITEVRSARAELNVPSFAQITLLHKEASPPARKWLGANKALVMRLARIERIAATEGEPPKDAIQLVLNEATIMLPIAGFIDITTERERLARELEKVDGEISRIEQKLKNEKFVTRAPEDVVEEQRERHANYSASRSKLADALDRLAAM